MGLTIPNGVIVKRMRATECRVANGGLGLPSEVSRFWKRRLVRLRTTSGVYTGVWVPLHPDVLGESTDFLRAHQTPEAFPEIILPEPGLLGTPAVFMDPDQHVEWGLGGQPLPELTFERL
jgi:hypothetical protein